MQQNTKEWLEFRKSKLGASDAPIVMGVSPWKTPYQLWQVKTGLKEDNYDNAAMQRGRDMEEEARKKFEAHVGINFHPYVVVSPTHDFMMASLDGFNGAKKMGVEIKCPGEADHSIAQKGAIPDKYIPQLQHQMHVAELDFIYYWSFDGSEGCLVEVAKDQKYIDKMIETEQSFYECMTTKTAPPFTDRDYRVRHDEKWTKLESDWVKAQAALKEAQELEKKAREELLKEVDFNTLGEAVKATQYTMRGTVDYQKIPELIGVDLDQYRKQGKTCWRLTAL